MKKWFYLAWALCPLTKLVYAYVALKSDMAAKSEAIQGRDPTGILGAIGLVMVVAGLAFAWVLFHKTGLVRKVALMFKYSIPNDKPETYLVRIFYWYINALGLMETTALFGLAGFLSSGSRPYLTLMLSASLVAWFFARPAFKPLEEDLPRH